MEAIKVGLKTRALILGVCVFGSSVGATVAGAMGQAGQVMWPAKAVWLLGVLWGAAHVFAFVKALFSEAP